MAEKDGQARIGANWLYVARIRAAQERISVKELLGRAVRLYCAKPLPKRVAVSLSSGE